jgi:hypothetical protein
MSHFYFSLLPGKMIEDPEGEDFSTIDDAKRHADRTARELGRNRRASEIAGLRICVTNESGQEVYSAPLVNSPLR